MSDKIVNKAKFAMHYGSEAHQTRVLSGNGKTTSSVRWCAAINGKKQHLDLLVKDKDPEVRAAVACQGHKEHLDKLVKDKDPDVRKKVAQYGDSDHHDKLVHDPDDMVRANVAINGNKHHADKLVHDDHPDVRYHAARRQDHIQRFSEFVDSIKDDPLLKDK